MVQSKILKSTSMQWPFKWDIIILCIRFAYSYRWKNKHLHKSPSDLSIFSDHLEWTQQKHANSLQSKQKYSFTHWIFIDWSLKFHWIFDDKSQLRKKSLCQNDLDFLNDLNFCVAFIFWIKVRKKMTNS